MVRPCNRLSSIFHREVGAGIFPQDWAGEIEPPGEFGERALL